MLETRSELAELGSDASVCDTVSSRDTLEHAWRYFALHAEQRVSMFGHFLVLFGLVAAGLAGCLQAQGVLRLVGVFLSVALTMIAFVFRKIDERSSFLVKHAETALDAAESAIPLHCSRLFRHEPAETSGAQLVEGAWTHGESFRAIFGIAQGVGVVGALLALALWLGFIH